MLHRPRGRAQALQKNSRAAPVAGRGCCARPAQEGGTKRAVHAWEWGSWDVSSVEPLVAFAKAERARAVVPAIAPHLLPLRGLQGLPGDSRTSQAPGAGRGSQELGSQGFLGARRGWAPRALRVSGVSGGFGRGSQGLLDVPGG